MPSLECPALCELNKSAVPGAVLYYASFSQIPQPAKSVRLGVWTLGVESTPRDRADSGERTRSSFAKLLESHVVGVLQQGRPGSGFMIAVSCLLLHTNRELNVHQLSLPSRSDSVFVFL